MRKASFQAQQGAEAAVNILEGIAAARQPITEPAWLAKMKRKGGTISTTSAPPQAQGPTQRRRLKSIAGFSSRRCHSAKEPSGPASQPQQLRPVPPCLAWPSRLAFRQGGLGPLAGKHLRGQYRSFYRSFYMQSHRRYPSTEGGDVV